MQATQVLMNEHRVIEQVLSCLERITELCMKQQKLDPSAAKDAIEFLRFFADRCHHGKEESHLFPMLEAKGFSRQSGPTGVMLHEHEDGRHHVQGMDETIEAASRGESDALKRFVTYAQAYVQLLRAHIQKEDHCLFPMANQVMTDEDQASLMESFESVEHDEMGEGTHEKYLAVANNLADRFGVPRAEITDGEHHVAWPCCHHR